MYTSYFGLKERPFSIAPDPQYLYMSSRHKEAMAHLSYGLSQGGCFIVLTGEVGTGKTTLCRNLLEEIADHVDVALILNAKINEIELLQTVCDELNITYTASASQKHLLDLINQHLLATYADNRQTVMIIDEAQLLSRDVLEQVRLLTNLETTKQKLLQIILIGQPELNDLLSRDDLRQLAQRVTARYHLSALQSAEIEDYVNYRLGVAGCKQPLFSKQALSKLFLLSGGIPRKINVLADHSLLSTYSKSEKLVNAQTVKVAAREVFIATQKKTPEAPEISATARKWWLPVAAILLLNVGLWWWFSADPEVSVEPAIAVLPAAVEGVSQAPVSEPQAIAENTAAENDSTDASSVDPVLAADNQLPENGDGVVEEMIAVAEADIGESIESADPEQQSLTAVAESERAEVMVLPVAEVPGSVSIADEYLSAEPELENLDNSELSKILETASDLTGRIAAFRNLAKLWNKSMPAQLIQPACQALNDEGLICLSFADWQQLERFNRPAILVLQHNNQLHRVIIDSIGQNSAGIRIGDSSYQVPLAELRQRWTGSGVIFWAPGKSQPIFLQQGDSSPLIPPLRERINRVLSETGIPLLSSEDSNLFDLDLSQKVFALQSRFSIIQDSKIGNETYLLLNELLQPESTPVLAPRAR